MIDCQNIKLHSKHLLCFFFRKYFKNPKLLEIGYHTSICRGKKYILHPRKGYCFYFKKDDSKAKLTKYYWK